MKRQWTTKRTDAIGSRSGGEGLVPISDRDKEKYCKTMYEWVLSPLKYAALPVCLCTLGGGNLPDFDVTMWKYNYTISRETLACHIIFTLGQSDCVLYLSIYPTSSLSGWGHFFPFFFCFGCCFLHQMSLNDLFMGVYLFSDIQSIFQRARGPRWESHGTISVMHMQLKELGCVWFQQETTRVLHYGMDARWQHCSAMLEPDKVSFWILQRKKRPVVFSMFLNLSLVLLSF